VQRLEKLFTSFYNIHGLFDLLCGFDTYTMVDEPFFVNFIFCDYSPTDFATESEFRVLLDIRGLTTSDDMNVVLQGRIATFMSL
jgi:hypothetical protein